MKKVVYYHNFGKIGIDSYNSFPIEKIEKITTTIICF